MKEFFEVNETATTSFLKTFSKDSFTANSTVYSLTKHKSRPQHILRLYLHVFYSLGLILIHFLSFLLFGYYKSNNCSALETDTNKCWSLIMGCLFTTIFTLVYPVLPKNCVLYQFF